jgi:hypothetical protein
MSNLIEFSNNGSIFLIWYDLTAYSLQRPIQMTQKGTPTFTRVDRRKFWSATKTAQTKLNLAGRTEVPVNEVHTCINIHSEKGLL